MIISRASGVVVVETRCVFSLNSVFVVDRFVAVPLR